MVISNAGLMCVKILDKDSTGTLSANGDAVYKWNDLSGNGHHAITYDSSPVLNATGLIPNLL